MEHGAILVKKKSSQWARKKYAGDPSLTPSNSDAGITLEGSVDRARRQAVDSTSERLLRWALTNALVSCPPSGLPVQSSGVRSVTGSIIH